MQLFRPCITTFKRKSRLHNETTGESYKAYIQNRFVDEVSIAYIFEDSSPAVGEIILDLLDGLRYTVLEVIANRHMHNEAAFEVVLQVCV